MLSHGVPKGVKRWMCSLVLSPAVLGKKYVWQKLCTKPGLGVIFVVHMRACV